MTESNSTLLPPLGERAVSVYRSLVEQIRSFVADQGFADVVVGISGGIDSALTTAIAADALGAEHVHGVVMPSRFTASASVRDATLLGASFGIDIALIDIGPLLDAYTESLDPVLGDAKRPVVDQNLQARIRANLLMALSNQFDWLVLATGNRTESMVGYTTLFGDMVGAFAPLAPLYKGWVFELARLRNEPDDPIGYGTSTTCVAPIPTSIIERIPSAELAPDQRDEDELGPYALLDGLLYHLSQGESAQELEVRGFSAHDVERVHDLVCRAEFKQRYAPPGAKLP